MSLILEFIFFQTNFMFLPSQKQSTKAQLAILQSAPCALGNLPRNTEVPHCAGTGAFLNRKQIRFLTLA